mgnify:CR=1 FL=1
MLASRFIRSLGKSQVRPLWDYCLIERFVTPDKTNSGLYLPDSTKSKMNEGVVLSTGPGKRDHKGNYTPMTLKAGDRVILADWSANEVKIEGKEYILLREDDILGKIEDK